MTWFLDLRVDPVGGGVVSDVSGIGIYDQQVLLSPETHYRFLDAILNRDVLFITHGFNVDRVKGRAALSGWESLLALPAGMVCVAVLWPGDSSWAFGLDYPVEGSVAIRSGNLLASFIGQSLIQATSLSFASHSLGARVVLQTVSAVSDELPVVHATLMAGAIDDDCLSNEYAGAAKQIGRIAVFSSLQDEVLALAFPLGNLASGIVTRGSPYWHGALGRHGSQSNLAGRVRGGGMIPDSWAYGHHSYLPPPDPAPGSPVVAPGGFGGGAPCWPLFNGWQPTWSANTASDCLQKAFT